MKPTIAATMLAAQMPSQGGDRTLTRHVIPGDEDEVVAADQDEREDHAGRASAAPRSYANRNAEEREHQARGGERDAVLNFDVGVAPGGPLGREKRGQILLVISNGRARRARSWTRRYRWECSSSRRW